MNLLRLFFSVFGRINRKTFLLAFIFLMVLAMGIGYLGRTYGLPPIIVNSYVLLMNYSIIALSIKRWHDINKSAWRVIAFFIPIVNLFALVELVYFAGDYEENKYGAPPNAT
jgi:uncharacterized membrane protein YhaH (DUF805 family)